MLILPSIPLVAPDHPCQRLEDHKTLQRDCHDDVNEDDQVMDVFCRFVNGKTYCLTISSTSDDLSSITQQLLSKVSTDLMATASSTAATTKTALSTMITVFLLFVYADLCFVYHGKPLTMENFHTLLFPIPPTCTSKRTPTNTATIFVSQRQRGGCFIVSFTIACLIGASLLGSLCTCGISLCVIPFLVPLLFILPLFCL